jgi:hypothetical protein
MANLIRWGRCCAARLVAMRPSERPSAHCDQPPSHVSHSEYLVVAQTAPLRAILGVLYRSPLTECGHSTRISAPVFRACF